MTRKAAIIGGGVTGGGWAARFLLMGWDVAVFDPDPGAGERLQGVLAQARRALPSLYDTALPSEGRLEMAASISDAVEGAVWVQESVPERLDLKRKVFQKIQESLGAGAIIGSSTSSFTPAEVQGCATRAAEIVVAHPCVPVYLLPLVELAGSAKNAPEVMERASETLTGVGMFPLHVHAGVPAQIAGRLHEALWREALCLIAEGAASVEEIDAAARMGFGLGLAQKGPFETLRTGLGAGHIQELPRRLGPDLADQRTRFGEGPGWTDDLVETIAAQSDEQTRGRPVEALEAERDLGLVGILRALKREKLAAGVHLNEVEARLVAQAGLPRRFEDITDLSAPIETVRRNVPLDWTDYNGHMNEAKYLQAFGDATDRFMEIVGCDADYIATGGSYFTVETHIRHIDEVLAGSPFSVTTTCLEGRGKKMHVFHEMRSGERLLATGEHLLLHVSLETRRSAPPAEHIEKALTAIAEAHAALPRPEGAGRAVGERP